jgi:hypothetical protein
MDQQKSKLDTYINEMWNLMMRKSRCRYHGMKRIVIQKLQLAERDYINKVKGKQASKIWDLGNFQIGIRKHNNKLNKYQQNKVWDTGIWRTIVKKSCIISYGQHQQWDQRGVKQLKTCDQEIVKFFNPGSLMQENFPFKINLVD